MASACESPACPSFARRCSGGEASGSTCSSNSVPTSGRTANAWRSAASSAASSSGSEGPNPDRPEHPAVERQHARGLGLAGVGRRPNRQLHHALPVEAGRKGVANTANRVLQLRALALDLLDLPGQLVGHAVELLAELGELVAAVGGHRMREVAAGHPPGCHQEGLDLRVERPADEGGEGERQEEEEHEHAQDQAAVVGHRGLERLGALEDRELHALITGAEASRAAAEHLLANLRVAHPVLGLEVPR